MTWQKLLESCVSETNTERLEKLVFDAEDAIFLQFRKVSTESHLSPASRALRKAADKLADLKIRKLGWRDPAGFNLFEVCGCGERSVQLNLYKVSFEGAAQRLRHEYSQLPCGFVVGKGAGSYGILLCAGCVLRLGFPLASSHVAPKV